MTPTEEALFTLLRDELKTITALLRWQTVVLVGIAAVIGFKLQLPI